MAFLMHNKIYILHKHLRENFILKTVFLYVPTYTINWGLFKYEDDILPE